LVEATRTSTLAVGTLHQITWVRRIGISRYEALTGTILVHTLGRIVQNHRQPYARLPKAIFRGLRCIILISLADS